MVASVGATTQAGDWECRGKCRQAAIVETRPQGEVAQRGAGVMADGMGHSKGLKSKLSKSGRPGMP